MIESLPDVVKVFSSILQQERQLTSNFPSDNSKILFAHTHNFSPNAKFHCKQNKGCGQPNFQDRGSNKFKICSFCGKTRQIHNTFYFKHSFPPGFRFKDKLDFSNNVDTSNEHQHSHQPTLITKITKFKSALICITNR